MTLKDNYIKACNAYLKAFCEMYDFDFDSGFWVSSEVGTITEVSRYYFDMQVIIYCVDNDVPEKELLDWYDYNLDAHSFGFNMINLPSWMKGCPRKSEQDIEEIRKKKEEIDRLRKELIKMNKALYGSSGCKYQFKGENKNIVLQSIDTDSLGIIMDIYIMR